MKTIDKLLDEYGKVNRIYGAALEGPIPSPECDKWFISVTISRAAVDAKVKEMQDRIAELERQNFLLEEDNMKYDMALIRKLTSETTPVSEIK